MNAPIRSWFRPLIRFLNLRSAARRSLVLADGGRRPGGRRPGCRLDLDGVACHAADAAASRSEEGCCHVS